MSALDAQDVILVRKCWIEAAGDEASPLVLSFLRPRWLGEDEVEATLRLECKYFDKRETLRGADELQAFVRLLHIGRIVLEARERDGYCIWHYEKGDLHDFDFWNGSRFEREFCLPSACEEAKRSAFSKAHEGETLLPSHRVGVEPDRPAVTIYRVGEDGGDQPWRVIGPQEIRTHTQQSLAELVGDQILWGSGEGIRIMARLPRRD